MWRCWNLEKTGIGVCILVLSLLGCRCRRCISLRKRKNRQRRSAWTAHGLTIIYAWRITLIKDTWCLFHPIIPISPADFGNRKGKKHGRQKCRPFCVLGHVLFSWTFILVLPQTHDSALIGYRKSVIVMMTHILVLQFLFFHVLFNVGGFLFDPVRKISRFIHKKACQSNFGRLFYINLIKI